MEALTTHRLHNGAPKQPVAEEFITGKTLPALSQRHDIFEQLVHICVGLDRGAGAPGKQLPARLCEVAHGHDQAHVRSQQALRERGQIDADDLKLLRSG